MNRFEFMRQSAVQYQPLALAEKEIFDTHGDSVSVFDTGSSVRKFGRNAATGGTMETIWQVGGDETYATTNAIDKISSSDAGDTQQVILSGMTISSGLLTRVTQTVTLDGQTETALATPMARIDRLKNDGTTDFAGDVYVYEDDTVTAGVPQTAANIHMKVVAGNQSERAALSTPQDEYLIITGAEIFVFTKTAEIAEFNLELRQVSATPKAFRRIYSVSASNTNSVVEYFDPPLIVPPNYDIRMRAASDGTSIDVGAAFTGHYAKVAN